MKKQLSVAALPYAGIIRIRFLGYDLRSAVSSDHPGTVSRNLIRLYPVMQSMMPPMK
jgi:hypothetical protein